MYYIDIDLLGVIIAIVIFHFGRLKHSLKYAAEIENVIFIMRKSCSTDSDFAQVDFIYYTGDLPAHNVWNQSRADQLYSINTINNMLATIFPNKTFYSAVGNHEAGISF